jgi:hypothetical protein
VTYLLATGVIASLVLSSAVGYVSLTRAPTSTTKYSPPVYNNTTRTVYENYTHWSNRTVYANSTIVQNRTYVENRTLYTNTTFWKNSTSEHWNYTTLYYNATSDHWNNTTIVEPVEWPVQIAGLVPYVICRDCGKVNLSVSLNTTTGAGLDEFFGVQALVTANSSHGKVRFEGAALVSYDPLNVTNVSASPFYLWGVEPWGWEVLCKNTTLRLMVEAPESPGSYYLGVVLYFAPWSC